MNYIIRILGEVASVDTFHLGNYSTDVEEI
jgi:hypothetical protein